MHSRSFEQRLTRCFLQFEALDAIEELAGSPNTTFFIAPFSANGQSPVILNIDGVGNGGTSNSAARK